MKKYIQRICCVLIILLVTQVLYGQAPANKTLSGKVIDKKDKNPIPGATVVIRDKDGRTIKGTATDIDGNYSLQVANPLYRVSVSSIGYKSTEPLEIGAKPVINFQLESNNNDLNEVTVKSGLQKMSDDGSGLLISDRDRTTSSFKLDAKEVQDMMATSIDQALQGRLPGVDIAAVSGDPGAPMQIKIRGTSTLNGNQNPLIIVDGMPYETTIPDDFNFATSDENGYGALLNIAPADIKDITVLKDAAATAIYGSQAANGVLVINTKRGVRGKPQLSYVFKGALSHQPSPIPTLNGDQYSTLILEEFYNAGRQFSTNENAKEFQYDPNDPLNFYNFSKNTNWIDALTQTGYTNDHSFSINGGGEKARYQASVNYVNQEGTTRGTDYSRITSRVNLDYSVSSKINFRADFAYTHDNNDQLYSSGVRNVAYIKMPNQSIFEYDEYGNLSGNYFSPASTAQGKYTGTYNPLAMANTGISKQLSERIIPKFQLRYNVSPLVTITSDVQFDISNRKTKTFLPQIATGLPFTDTHVNAATDGDVDGFSVATKTNIIYNPLSTEKHFLTGLISLQSSDRRTTGQALSSTNSASAFLEDPTDPARIEADGSAAANASQTRTLAAVAQANYKFMDRYLLSGSARLDGSSRFGPGNRFGIFPGISAAWIINEEPIFRKMNKIDQIKLRLSYGEIGNAPRSDYTFYNTFQSYGFSYLDQTGVVPGNVELTNLKWEKKTSYNAGIDLAFFNNRLTATADIYKDHVTQLFYNDLQIATYNGYSGVDLNSGTMDNQGWEIYLGTTPVITKNLRVDVSFNIAYNENVIREVSRLVPRENSSKVTDNGKFKTYLQENTPFGAFYGFRYKGVYPDKASTIAKDKNGQQIIAPNGQPVYMRIGGASVDYQFQPGDSRYEDINHDGLIDYKDVVYLGNGNPKFTGGFYTSFTWKKNFRLATNFSFRQGNDLINGTKISSTSMYNFNNQSTAVLRRWRKEGDVTDIPRAMYGTGYNYLGSDKYIEDGSFLRLRSVTFSYDFPQLFAKKVGLNSLRMYLTAEGIFTLTHYTGQDPEVGINIKNAYSVVTDNSTTPPLKTVTLGLSVTF